jgi:hydrogenase expression/formation protein HypC
MCLGIPGKVVSIYEEHGLQMGDIDYGGTVSKACLEYVPDIKVGQYTIVHAGFGISIIDEEEALASYQAWEEMDSAAAAEGVDLFGNPVKNRQVDP